MKISIVSRFKDNPPFELKEILKAGKKEGVEIELLNFKSLKEAKVKKWGDVVFWRSSNLGPGREKTALMRWLISQKKVVLNPGLMKYPEVSFKDFQQEFFQKNWPFKVRAIPTYQCNNFSELKKLIRRKKLWFPLVAKEKNNSKGRGVIVINKRESLKEDLWKDFSKMIFQNFIPNQSDYRVLVVGGAALGVLKRTAKKGSFLNNFSQGGNISPEKDPVLKEKLENLGAFIACALGLSVCGVDLILDSRNGKIYFLEINTAPEWEAFQKITGVKPAEKIIALGKALSKRGRVPIHKLIEDYYCGNRDLLGLEELHLISRMSLWTKKSKWKVTAQKIENKYLGRTKEERKKILESLIKSAKIKKLTKNRKRNIYLEKYPHLLVLHNLMFRGLLAETVFKKDIRSSLSKYLKEAEIIEYCSLLAQDKKAVAFLSTFAVNFFCLSEWYLKKELRPPIDFFINAGKLLNEKNISEVILKIYLFTHLIIGFSLFYARKISEPKKEINKIFIELEILLKTYYAKIPLDVKLEFLVVGKLAGRKIGLRKKILHEAERNLSPVGNFISNEQIGNKLFTLNSFKASEHRNILYLMANN